MVARTPNRSVSPKTAGRGSGGGRTCPSGRGAPCARTTARTATRGSTFPTTTPARAPTAGTRTASAGICDDQQRLCFAFAFWNGRDPILKERIFGLTGNEGNHGEDAKEYWWYLDSTPTHSWMRWRYLYPQAEFPYERLVDENGARAASSPSSSCSTPASSTRTATGTSRSTTRRPTPTTSCIRVRVRNAGPDEATLHVLPTLWFRNTWSWGLDDRRPRHRRQGRRAGRRAPQRCGRMLLVGDGDAASRLFCDNESNARRLWGVDGDRRSRRTASTTTWCTARPTVNPDADRHQGGAVVPARGAGGRDRRDAAAAFIRRRRPVDGESHDVLADSRAPRPTSSTPRSRPSTPARGGRGDAPGARRDAVVEAVLPLRRRPLARR